MDKKTEVFERMPVPKAVMTLAVPTVLSMLVTIIYNMADTYFVGQINDPDQVAAVTLTMPVFMVFMAFGNMFGMGGSSMISRTLGIGDKKTVKNISSFCFYGALTVGIAAVVAFLAGMPYILKAIGTDEATYQYANEYLIWIVVGAPFIVVSNAFSNIVRSEGAAKAAMIGMMIGTVTNIILDPIMILQLDMGVAGAAIATIIGNFCSFVYYVVYVCSDKSLLSIAPSHFTVKNKIPSCVFSIGVPATVNNLLMSTANIIMNNFLQTYGNIAVAAMGIAMKANMLVIMVQIGISMGVQPLIGYNFGARNYKRMRAVMKFAIGCTVTFGTLVTAIYYLTTKSVIGLFIDNAEVIKVGADMLRALMIAGPFLGILFVLMSTFQSMGKALPSLILSVSRQGLVFIPFLIIANKLFGLDGIIYTASIADIVSIILAITMFMFIGKRARQ